MKTCAFRSWNEKKGEHFLEGRKGIKTIRIQVQKMDGQIYHSVMGSTSGFPVGCIRLVPIVLSFGSKSESC